MNLSLVIACRDDPHILKLMETIDVDLPVIVSLVPNEELERELRALGVTVVTSVSGNISISYARGLAAADTESAFIVDSDCLLGPGCLSTVNELLEEAPLARARVEFASTPNIRFSDKIARMRSLDSNTPPLPAWTPGLGLRLEIKHVLGGHFYDERVCWASGAEIDRRVKRANLNVAYSPEAYIVHGPISLSHELRSGYKMGMGTRAQIKLGLCAPDEEPSFGVIKRLIGAVWDIMTKGRTADDLPDDDLATRLIRWAWKVAFHIGYYRVYHKRPEDITIDHC